MTKATGLQLITNDKFKKTLKTGCKTTVDNEVNSFNEFITIGHNDVSGETTLVNNADAITIVRAKLMIDKLVQQTLGAMTEAEQDEIMSVV